MLYIHWWSKFDTEGDMDSISEQMIEALGIMLLGMGLVFVFLSMLILGIKLVAYKFAPQPIEHNEPAKREIQVPHRAWIP